MTVPVRLGLRANARQFALLVALNALVGSMVGLARSVLPVVGKKDFSLSSTTSILAFSVAFAPAQEPTHPSAGYTTQRPAPTRRPVTSRVSRRLARQP